MKEAFGELWLFSAMESKPIFMKESAYRADKRDTNHPNASTEAMMKETLKKPSSN